jgi:hypothetical protein
MPRQTTSLMTGRNTAPLSQSDVRRATNTLMGFDSTVDIRYTPDNRTVFRVSIDDDTGEEFGQILFGPDIYPGRNTVDANSALSMDAAAAHEVTHYHRWKDKQALPEDELEHVDEALTSLQAIQRFGDRLNLTDIRQLVADAIARITLHLAAHDTGHD